MKQDDSIVRSFWKDFWHNKRSSWELCLKRIIRFNWICLWLLIYLLTRNLNFKWSFKNMCMSSFLHTRRERLSYKASISFLYDPKTFQHHGKTFPQIISTVIESNHPCHWNLIVTCQNKMKSVLFSLIKSFYIVSTEVWDTTTYCCNENGCNESTIVSISKFLLIATTMMFSARHLCSKV